MMMDFKKLINNNRSIKINLGSGYICFFIGTEAELIKLFPVMLDLQGRGIQYKIISSGQNDISKSTVLKVVNNGKIDVILSDYLKIKKSAFGLLRWFIMTSQAGIKCIRSQLWDVNFKSSIMVVHGDTVSTVMGARLGVMLGMQVAHIEAGLRSFDFLNPFPEEIDRILTSHYARIHFAPGEDAMKNLRAIKGEKINTTNNTILDSLKFSETVKLESVMSDLFHGDYFVFVMHRQENLAKKEFASAVLRKVIKASKQMKCIMILHKPTEVALQNMGLLDDLLNVDTITTITRMEYFNFMKLLANTKFVITDGGSNQEELSYMGKPCLILRKKTERNDGIGKNVVLYGGDVRKIDEFIADYSSYKYPVASYEVSPSKIIVDNLIRYLNG
jgi:UDP-N-acetylglucosamine 2-epimerase (non-hydrolysing)